MDPDYANYEVQFKYACRLPSFTLFKMGSFMFRPTTFKKKKTIVNVCSTIVIVVSFVPAMF